MNYNTNRAKIEQVICGDIAQWESACLADKRSRVQVPLSPPEIIFLFINKCCPEIPRPSTGEQLLVMRIFNI